METILNNAVKAFNFSFYDAGRLVTIQVVPGFSKVKKVQLDQLKKVAMFQRLVDDGVIIVGASQKSTDEEPQEAKTRKAPETKAKKKAKKKESGLGDLEDL